ncbi:MAG: tRNA (adenosine(37)-N6)-threonylcarbamoyltransferase complex transferase subunit TsaD [Cyclobacteriaceae bacterium]
MTILGIESSCDESAAAICKDGEILNNKIATQDVHIKYGGVVPELASRAHQQNIVPIVSQSIQEAGIDINDIDAIAYTQGPGLLGALLVGNSFAKGLALSLNKPLIPVNHMHGHIMAHFIKGDKPQFPFICLTVSGGHTQIVLVSSFTDMKIIGSTIDDAVGEAFDKSAKLLGLGYPGGPQIDKLASNGNQSKYHFKAFEIGGYNYSFSGIKTSFLYFLKDQQKQNPNFISENKADLAASIQFTLIEMLMIKLKKAAHDLKISEIAIAGGVSANSGLRNRLKEIAKEEYWNTYITDLEYCTDNAAMIALTGYFQYKSGQLGSLRDQPKPRMSFNF